MSKLDTLMQSWNKDAGAVIAQHGGQRQHIPRIPFSSVTANYMTYGGIPRGKVTEFFGGEGGGKTTSALDLVVNAQKLFLDEWHSAKRQAESELSTAIEGKASKKRVSELETKLEGLQRPKEVVYFDLENTLDLDWAEKIGVDIDSMILVKPESDTAEFILQKIIDFINTGEVGLLILDSVPCLVPQQIFEESIEKKSYAGVSSAMSVFCSKIPPYLTKHGTALVFINQVREDLSNPYNDISTPGGKALKHLYSVRLRFRKGNLIDENNREVPSRTENPAGNIVQIELVKTKAFPPDRRLGSYTLNYYSGIDVAADLAALALRYGYIVQSGAWYTFIDAETGEIVQDAEGNDLKFQGMSKLLEFLRIDDVMYNELYVIIHGKILG